ncbi:Pkinase-domain-containing protein [Auriculariales sp. MPI-PUGE-AT-0066]|nr:Pkinase-domain-containing protein [Auriculariales sp. MPI-PUGE-AT-0066]
MALKLGYAFNRASAFDNAPAPKHRDQYGADYRVSENKPPLRAMGPPTTPVAPKVSKPAMPYNDRPVPMEKEAPLPRQNTKAVPPSPPQVIRDSNRLYSFTRMGFLGEGGFARVYEALDHRGGRHAIKVVTKASLKTKKAKTKLYAEIRIHRALDHPNIVNFRDCFEDNENVYMTLELCESGSLMDLLRRRRRFTEPEARYFMVQLIGACHYMHNNQVIHRDLKLGNLFLDREMNIKVGDFGLAALIENPGERKKTICGTPNYIAPEVLFDSANGHSFEVDTWSTGVILYTLLIGKPPFQTKDVKTIYQRIKDNDYDFPSDKPVDVNAKALVSAILTPDPRQRPQLEDIVDHRWFTHGIVPATLPKTALDFAPDFRRMTSEESRVNLSRLRRRCLLDEDQDTATSIAASTAGAPSRSRAASAALLAQQEREFNKAIQPGSPISALLKSAREPLVVTNGERPRPDAPAASSRRDRLATPIKSSLRQSTTGLDNIDETDEVPAAEEQAPARRELESQKARIVAQMAPEKAPEEDEEPAPSVQRARTTSAYTPLTRVRTTSTSTLRAPTPASASVPAAPAPALSNELDLRPDETYEGMSKILSQAIEAKDGGRLFRDPKLDADRPKAKVFLVSWVDYCNKYGMGYALTDGCVGVYFNDTTSLVLSADKEHLDFMQPRKSSTSTLVRKQLVMSSYPEDMKNKVYLLKHFEKYMMGKLYGEYDYTYVDSERTTGMVFVQRYFRTKHGMLFLFSHETIQFNFNDHTKMIISQNGHAIAQIDREYRLTHFTLSEIMARSLDPAYADDKELNRIVDKLRFLREVLRQAAQAVRPSSRAVEF